MAINKETVYNDIKRAIITTELEPNMKLNDNILMERFNISRTPLREVLLRLQEEGLITIVPRMGTVVAPLEISKIREIVEMRKELEAFAGELAARKISPQQLTTLRDIVDKFSEVQNSDTPDYKTLIQLDSQFHQFIHDAAANSELTRCAERNQQLILRYWYSTGFSEKEFIASFDNLNNILKALEQKDPAKVRTAIEEHISQFVSRLTELFKW